MDEYRLNELTALARDFRSAIERSRSERASPHLPYFPDGACRLVSRLFALHLGRREGWPADATRFLSGHVPEQERYVRHTWLLVDDAIVDLTADPFGAPPVVVGAPTAFHASLDTREEETAASALARLSREEIERLHRLLGPIEARVPGYARRADPAV